ncbi:MAG: HD domain-containing protein [Candidatus Saccharimonadales bacterium]
MEHPLDVERIAQLHLRELTREGGEGLLLERFYIETLRTNWTDDEKSEVMNLADDIVHLYHAGDSRDDHTYATHVLRVATRILSPDHFNVRDDPELIIAALLHDVVEDHPERLLGLDVPKAVTLEEQRDHRERALKAIAKKYDDGDGRGDRIAAMVNAVSNPLYDKEKVPQEQRPQIYRSHVKELMKSKGKACLIKLSDFIDNCLGLNHNPDSRLQRKLAPKYLPLVDDMRDYVIRSELAESVKEDILIDLDHAESLCKRVIEHGADVFQSLGGVATLSYTANYHDKNIKLSTQ